ncbi:MAG: MazG-like family protein [Anaerolinea sp.]|nr:MazG-like family protein [Anaerolinea sp.]
MIDQIRQINQGLDKRFPEGRDPFQIMTRLAEECGELAAQVNHFENSGVKRLKHGEPDKTKLAKEVMDVLRCALQIADYYQAGAELEAVVAHSHRYMRAQGLIE